VTRARLTTKENLVPFILVTALFFLWGIAHGLLDVLNKHFQEILQISKARSGLIQFAMYTAYFTMALPAGLFMKRHGYRKGIILGLLLFAVGAFLIAGTTAFESFWIFLTCLFILGCGLTTLETSNVNLVPGSVTPNLVMARPDADGNVCIIASTTTHLIVDRFASFDAGEAIDLVRPDRVTDTRSDGSTRAPGRVVRFSVGDTELDTGSPIEGVLMNLTIVEPEGAGFGTAYPCAGGRPDTSNINFGRGRTIANFAVVQPDSNGEICVYSSVAADILIDVMGSAGTGFEGIGPSRKVDTRSGIGTP